MSKIGIVLRTVTAIVVALISGSLLSQQIATAQQYDPRLYSGLRWRSIGPFRAGRVNAVSGVVGQPETFYFGSVGGGAMLSMDVSLPTVFLIVGIPAVIAGLTMFGLGQHRSREIVALALEA